MDRSGGLTKRNKKRYLSSGLDATRQTTPSSLIIPTPAPPSLTQVFSSGPSLLLVSLGRSSSSLRGLLLAFSLSGGGSLLVGFDGDLDLDRASIELLLVERLERSALLSLVREFDKAESLGAVLRAELSLHHVRRGHLESFEDALETLVVELEGQVCDEALPGRSASNQPNRLISFPELTGASSRGYRWVGQSASSWHRHDRAFHGHHGWPFRRS
jgi:hypothetical protein